MTTIVAKALDNYARASINPFFSDRMSTVGASEIGQCIRKIFWMKNEEDPELAVPRDPDHVDGWGARWRGSVFERALWVPAMRRRFGRRLLYAGRSQQTFTHNYLSATPDGVVVRLTPAEREEIGGLVGDTVLFECKTLDPRAVLTEPKAENVYQGHVQAGILHAITALRPSHIVISYADASFWSDVKEFVVAYDPDIYEAAQARAAKIMTSTDLEDIPPEGWIAGGYECRYCPFTKPCGVERRNLPYADDSKPLDPQFTAEITDLARQLKAAEREGEASETQVRALQDDIKNRLRAKGVRKVPGVVAWSEVKGRSGYDNKALHAAAAAAGVDIEQYATQGQPGDRLVISIAE